MTNATTLPLFHKQNLMNQPDEAGSFEMLTVAHQNKNKNKRTPVSFMEPECFVTMLTRSCPEP